jgi:hypothetical protein
MLHEMLRVFINLLDENVFQNPQIFHKTLRLFPEQSTLVFNSNVAEEEIARQFPTVRSELNFFRMHL